MSANVCVCVCVRLINVMLKMQLLSLEGFVAFVDYGRTVQSDIYIGHVMIANSRLCCSQHWGTLHLIFHHLRGHLHTQEPDVYHYAQQADGLIKL